MWVTYSENSLLVLGEGVLTDKLHDLSQLIFLLEDLLDSFAQAHELGFLMRVVLCQDAIVVREGDVPVHAREVLPLSQLLVQAPEDLHDGKCG